MTFEEQLRELLRFVHRYCDHDQDFCEVENDDYS